MVRIRRYALLWLAVLAISGCAGPLLRTGKPLLAQPKMSPDSVALDMYFVRCPFDDSIVNEKLWEQIDEQQIAPELRERLARNGFRVGLVGGALPMELSKLLQLTDKPAPTGHPEEAKIDKVEARPCVVWRHLQLRAGQTSEIQASRIYDQLPVLVNEDGQVTGQPYSQAQGVFTIKPLPQPDGWVRVELVPELQYGQVRPRFESRQGMTFIEPGRPKRTFDNMTISANLPPGGILVLSRLPNRPGSLGHYFFTEDGDGLEQKLLVVRLSQTQHDGLFDEPSAPTELPK